MANAMHNSWKSAKSGLQKQIDDVKKNGGLNPKPIQDALKSFDSGFGPLIDKCAKADKEKTDADVKKYAKDAITVAEKYLGTVTNRLYASMKNKLSILMLRCRGRQKVCAFRLGDFRNGGRWELG